MKMVTVSFWTLSICTQIIYISFFFLHVNNFGMEIRSGWESVLGTNLGQKEFYLTMAVRYIEDSLTEKAIIIWRIAQEIVELDIALRLISMKNGTLDLALMMWTMPFAHRSIIYTIYGEQLTSASTDRSFRSNKDW